jgi:protein phosphatase
METGVLLSWGCLTDRGLRRERNEDSFIAADPLFAVADGMGGHEAGEIASGICVRTLAEVDLEPDTSRPAAASGLQDALEQADRRIRQATGSRAGTTVSGVVLVAEQGQPYWLVFNIGDSRTYALSGGKFSQLTVDHSEVQELVDAGQLTAEAAALYPRRHVLTRALGAGESCSADFQLIPVRAGDRILMCSDGLSGEVPAEDIERILAAVTDPQEAAGALVRAALDAGGSDNVTAVVVDAQAGPRATPATAPQVSSADAG